MSEKDRSVFEPGIEAQAIPTAAASPSRGPRFIGKTFAVALREFKATAMTKAFFLAAVIVPILMIGLSILGPILFNPQPPPLKGTVAIIDPDGGLARAAEIEFAPDKIREHIHGTAKAREQSPSGLADAGSVGEGMGRSPGNMGAVT